LEERLEEAVASEWQTADATWASAGRRYEFSGSAHPSVSTNKSHHGVSFVTKLCRLKHDLKSQTVKS
jgi:hypothetical protein